MSTSTIIRNVSLGDIVITPNARSILTPAEITSALKRHSQGDWGDLCENDAETNNHAYHDGRRLLSAYGQGKRRFWIITDGDGTLTTILMPADY